MDFLWNVTATTVFLFCAAMLFLRWLSQTGVELPGAISAPLPRRAGEKPGRDTLWRIFFVSILFRLVTAVGSLILYNCLQGASLGILDIPSLWARWDAPHYIKLVELGYSGYMENGQNLFLVFFPLYVWITRLVRLVIRDTALAGMVVSFVCFGWGNVYLYRLAAEEYGVKTAKTSLLLLWAYPFSFFFGGIMTESLFLLTTTAGLYHIRRHQWGRAAIWGILAALTRMQGVILVGAALAEICCAECPFAKRGSDRRRVFLRIGARIPVLCAPILGSMGYLGLNYYVAGDPFAFTVMQQHWSQGFMWFPKVLAYLAKNAWGWYDVMTRWEMWIPELLLFPLCALLLLKSWKRHRSMLTLYGFVYFILNYCLSWLLSAGRYLACGVPLFLFSGELLAKRPKPTAAVIAIMGLLQCFFLYRYLCWGQVM